MRRKKFSNYLAKNLNKAELADIKKQVQTEYEEMQLLQNHSSVDISLHLLFSNPDLPKPNNIHRKAN